mgnify:CR=1 FL=1
MAKQQVRKFQFASHNRTLNEIKSYYDKMLSSLEYKYSRNHNPLYAEMFADMSEAAVERELGELKEELSLEGSFELLSFLEKEFRTDCYLRCKGRFRDELSRGFKRAFDEVGHVQYRIPLLDVIVEGWKQQLLSDTPHDAETLAFFSGISDIFNFRNWMAHGRYWEFSYSRGKHHFDSIWLMVNHVEDVLGDSFKRNEPIGEKA